MQTVLIIEDDRNMRLVLAAMVEREGFRARTAADGREGVDSFLDDPPDIVLTDLRMPGLDGLGVLDRVVETDAEVPVILLTAHGTVENAVAALKAGAFDFLTKPFDEHELSNVLRKAGATRERTIQDARATGRDRRGRSILGEDPKIERIYEAIAKVAATPSTVLVTGESGTGKELVAREIHRYSDRRDRPFIKINCAAIPHNLVESELFGYERGAFTGAVTHKPGRFELADGGTLFLDEIGAIGLDVQTKLLQVLQEGRFERVGGIKTIRIDVRLVAATNTRLAEAVAAGSFREDLFYRLNVVPIELPPLRDRRGDVPILARHFLDVFGQRPGRKVAEIGDEALAILCAHAWPGNVRELENAIERAVLFAAGEVIVPGDLPDGLGQDALAGPGGAAEPIGDLKETVRRAARDVEMDLIRRALAETGGNVTRAADLLGISRKGLQLKMKELGLRS